MQRKFLIVSSFSGFICVLLGAFGAHWLKKIIAPDQLIIYDTAVRYQFFHTFALIAVSLLMPNSGHVLLKRAGYFFIAGIIFFSGSLYLLSARELIGSEMQWLGPVTPLGGLFFITGWLLLLTYAIKINKKT